MNMLPSPNTVDSLVLVSIIYLFWLYLDVGSCSRSLVECSSSSCRLRQTV